LGFAAGLVVDTTEFIAGFVDRCVFHCICHGFVNESETLLRDTARVCVNVCMYMCVCACVCVCVCVCMCYCQCYACVVRTVAVCVLPEDTGEQHFCYGLDFRNISEQLQDTVSRSSVSTISMTVGSTSFHRPRMLIIGHAVRPCQARLSFSQPGRRLPWLSCAAASA